MRISRFAAAILSSGLLLPATLRCGGTMDLSGRWRFELDRSRMGAAGAWFSRPLAGSIMLPGSLPSQGIGDPITLQTEWTGGIVDRSYFSAPEYARYREPGNIKVPFWLQPGTHYVGAAWFQRDVVIPPDWAGRRLVLTLERPHWKTTLWLDDRECGSNDSLSVAHVYDLGTEVAPGRHVVTLRVDNTLAPDIGENSHSVSDHTQGNWNGVVGRVELAETEAAWIDDLQVYPSAARHTVVARGRVATAAGRALAARIRIAAGPLDGALLSAVEAAIAADGTFTAEISLGDRAPLWDEFVPARHHLVASLDNGEQRDVVFGLRDLATSGHDLSVNGRRLFLRGTLECAAYPRTGHPPMDVASWERFFRIVKAHGLNHVRFHSWCPPEEAFNAADELGVYLQVEMASWPNQSTTLGDGRPVDRWMDAETTRILRAYGNHPSFAFASACNEPGGDNAGAWLSGWIARHRAADPRHLYTSGSGWPELPENDYNVRPQPRIQHWGEGLDSRINRLPPETRSDYSSIIQSFRAPVVSHEIGQWCVYPNFDEMPKYTGYLKPRNFEIFRSSLAEHHLSGQAHDFLMASGKLQVLCYKEDIESALRTPDMGGFQLLGLSDFPGQGTALVGVLDAFWDEKGYVTPQEFRRFCNSTVPLARLDRRVFTTRDHLACDVEVAHFGPSPLPRAASSWRLVGDNGAVVARGRFNPRDIPVGSGIALGRVDLALNFMPAPARYKLIVALDGTAFENDWDVWVYPSEEQVASQTLSGITIARRFDAKAQAQLESGAAMILMLAPENVRPDPKRGRIELGFSSIFWNTAWTKGQAPHTLGILCDPRHAALASFPTDPYSNWQWWYPIKHAAAMILDDQPAALRPIVQVIDDWFTNRKLGLVFEARVGRGRLIVTSIDLEGPNLDPVRHQLRASLIRYAQGPAFHPTVTLTPEDIRRLSSPLPAQ